MSLVYWSAPAALQLVLDPLLSGRILEDESSKFNIGTVVGGVVNPLRPSDPGSGVPDETLHVGISSIVYVSWRTQSTVYSGIDPMYVITLTDPYQYKTPISTALKISPPHNNIYIPVNSMSSTMTILSTSWRMCK
jgi:hypothetical protein